MKFLATAVSVLMIMQGVNSACIKGYEQYGSSCYKISDATDYVNFATATTKCQAEGGALAAITNAFIDSFVIQLAQKSGALSYWIGLKCTHGNIGTCHWIEQGAAPFQYSNFYPGYPAINGDCVVNGLLTNTWVTSECTTHFRYVCETKHVAHEETVQENAVHAAAADAESMIGHPKNIKNTGLAL